MRATGEFYSIVRVAKLKNTVSGSSMNREGKTKAQPIDDAADHELRLKQAKNANPARRDRNQLFTFVGGVHRSQSFKEAESMGLLRRSYFRDLVREKLTEYGIAKTRKDSVLAQQVQLTASYGFFTRDRREWDPRKEVEPSMDFVVDEKHRSWRTETIKFALTRFGDRVLCGVEHLDELTPHITFVVVPLVEKEERMLGRGKKNMLTGAVKWRLSAADVFNKKTLPKLLDEYANAMKRFGLRRPPSRAIADHSTIRDFYSGVMDAKKQAEELEKGVLLELPEVFSRFGLSESAETYRRRAEKQLEEQKRALKELLERLKYRQHYVDMVRQTETLLRKEVRTQQEEIEMLRKERILLREIQIKWERSRAELSFQDVLSRFGLPYKRGGRDRFYCDLPGGRWAEFSSNRFEIIDDLRGTITQGDGAVEFLADLFRIRQKQASKLLLEVFGHQSIGSLIMWTTRKAPTETLKIEAPRKSVTIGVHQKSVSVTKLRIPDDHEKRNSTDDRQL